MVAERKDHVFKDLAADDQEQQPMEIESYCINCGENVRAFYLLELFNVIKMFTSMLAKWSIQ